MLGALMYPRIDYVHKQRKIDEWVTVLTFASNNNNKHK